MKSLKNFNTGFACFAYIALTLLSKQVISGPLGVKMLSKITNHEDISKLFPKTAQEIINKTNEFMLEDSKKLEKIINIKAQDRTLENTIKAFDQLYCLSDLAIFAKCLEITEILSPEKELRDAAHDQILKIQGFEIENMSNNVNLYRAIKDYYTHNNALINSGNGENLTPEEKYFIEETLQDYKRAGLDLPENKLEQVKKLNKELGELELQFETNIAQNNKTITVSKEQLAGLDQEFIGSLKKPDQNSELFILGTDYPTYFNVMDNCSVESTREKLYTLFSNRAYPVNEKILVEIIEKRDQLAKLLGFTSYAQLDLDDQMAKNPQTVKNFLTSLYQKAEIKTKQEFDLLKANLPDGVTCTKDNKIKAWDLKYIKNCYKKKYLQLDEQEIAQYFPTEKTVKELLDIYAQFFSLKFVISDAKDLWHQDVKFIEVYENSSPDNITGKQENSSPDKQENSNPNNITGKQEDNNKLIGYLLLDLHPRENKYGHACQATVVHAVKDSGPCLAVIVANFPKETKNKPALLKRDDVETFFHELGHALHSIFGRTAIASFSGSNVKTDFVEMPSQMLEQWVSDKEILKKISSHYKTGEPLPDKLIEKIIKIKNFETGDQIQRQCFLASLSLEYFNGENIGKTPKEVLQMVTDKMRKNIECGNNNNLFASFGHLASSMYGAKYYCYQWALVFALDMFGKIKNQGLLNPIAGAEYKEKILCVGGSKDPNILLRDFLGREPSQDAYFKNMGI